MSAAATPQSDERVRQETLFTKLAKRPELGSIAGLVLVTVFFLFTADASMFTLSGVMNFLTPAAQLGILAIGAALLMIGGEFDLSIGSMVAFAGMIFGAFTVNMGLPLILAIPATLAVAAVDFYVDSPPYPASLFGGLGPHLCVTTWYDGVE